MTKSSPSSPSTKDHRWVIFSALWAARTTFTRVDIENGTKSQSPCWVCCIAILCTFHAVLKKKKKKDILFSTLLSFRTLCSIPRGYASTSPSCSCAWATTSSTWTDASRTPSRCSRWRRRPERRKCRDLRRSTSQRACDVVLNALDHIHPSSACPN